MWCVFSTKAPRIWELNQIHTKFIVFIQFPFVSLMILDVCMLHVAQRNRLSSTKSPSTHLPLSLPRKAGSSFVTNTVTMAKEATAPSSRVKPWQRWIHSCLVLHTYLLLTVIFLGRETFEMSSSASPGRFNAILFAGEQTILLLHANTAPSHHLCPAQGQLQSLTTWLQWLPERPLALSKVLAGSN